MGPTCYHGKKECENEDPKNDDLRPSDQTPGGYLSQFVLGMYHWPLRVPNPLQSILWPIIDPILDTFEEM